MELVLYPDPRLSRRVKPVREFDAALAETAREMFAEMYAQKGVGLAGPQVGIMQRIMVINCKGEPDGEIVFVNPEILTREGEQVGEEGCLSFPDILATIKRAMKVTVRAQDVTGKPFEMTAEALLSRAIQHELDHLDGILFTTLMSPAERAQNAARLKALERAFAEKSAPAPRVRSR